MKSVASRDIIPGKILCKFHLSYGMQNIPSDRLLAATLRQLGREMRSPNGAVWRMQGVWMGGEVLTADKIAGNAPA
jgi:hypothetical protein